MKKFIILMAVIFVVLIGVFLVRSMTSRPTPVGDSEYIVATDDEILIIIPPGTGAAIEAGQYPVIVHDDIILTLGRQDRLTIRNEDNVDHTIGLFFVGAGQTISQKFTRPAILEGSCSFQGGNVRIIILDGD